MVIFTMLSMLHEALVEVFRGHPEAVPQLLVDILGIQLPRYTGVRIESADLTDVSPAEYRADLVVLLVEERPVQAIVLEVQLRGDPRKRLTWPAYVVNQRQRLDVPTCLIVVTPDAAVARWAAEAIETGHPGFVMTPLVLGPSTLPVVKDVESARRAPEAAVLSVMAHGKGEDGLRIAQVVLKAIDGLDDERKLLYADISFLSVNEAARRALEAMMKGGYEYQSDFAKTYFGQGRAEGRAQEGAFAVLAVLDARGIEVLEAVRQRVLGCKDVETLESWLRRAAVVPKASDIFAESKNS